MKKSRSFSDMKPFISHLSIFCTATVALVFLAPHALADSKEPAKTCRDCHDAMGTPVPLPSPHSSFECKECHQHATGACYQKAVKETGDSKASPPPIAPDEIRLDEQEVFAVSKQCQACHEAEYKDWSQSRHTFTYAESFLNAAHNKAEQPINDCLRCHAMFFDGSIGDIVAPLDNTGPWKLKQPDMASRLSIPCLSCHRIHPPEQAPAPLARYAALSAKPASSVHIGFFDRREKLFFALDDLPHPQVNDGQKPVLMSKDPRIRNCYQCHAPNAAHRIKTSDDKTPAGVHAGLSCLDCHNTHSLSARGSCAKCHDKVTRCTLDVAQMDTHPKSRKLDVHTVACADCHAENGKAGR